MIDGRCCLLPICCRKVSYVWLLCLLPTSTDAGVTEKSKTVGSLNSIQMRGICCQEVGADSGDHNAVI